MWVERADDHVIWVGGPVPPGAAGWTLGSLVIVRRRFASHQLLLAHEAEHVRQWREKGVVGFLAWYLAGYLRGWLLGYNHGAAYRRIPAEIQADWRSRRATGMGATGSPCSG